MYDIITSPPAVIILLFTLFFSSILWATGGHKGSATTPTTDEHIGPSH